MKAKQDLDKVFGAAGERIEQEVSALLGKNFVVSEPTTELIGKEDFFERLSGKKVIFRLKIEGQVETEGYLLVSLADAIRIGGTLIMLPSAELAEVIERQEYNEELQDSYGEIANIMAGSLTSSFEENYRKSIRLIRKTQEVITPIKVDVESDVPCPNGTYYLVTSKMSMGEESMGEFHLLLPGMPFGLVEPPPKPVEKEVVSEAGEPGTVETTEVSPEVTGQEEKDVRPAEGMTEPPDL
ncbi:MAG: chemotaxis protein CheX, partial [Desulfobulbaceae bacterium]|nr:chemotaxis protein CheX [Desulfobulbaceae bacterium]